MDFDFHSPTSTIVRHADSNIFLLHLHFLTSPHLPLSLTAKAQRPSTKLFFFFFFSLIRKINEEENSCILVYARLVFSVLLSSVASHCLWPALTCLSNCHFPLDSLKMSLCTLLGPLPSRIAPGAPLGWAPLGAMRVFPHIRLSMHPRIHLAYGPTDFSSPSPSRGHTRLSKKDIKNPSRFLLT